MIWVCYRSKISIVIRRVIVWQVRQTPQQHFSQNFVVHLKNNTLKELIHLQIDRYTLTPLHLLHCHQEHLSLECILNIECIGHLHAFYLVDCTATIWGSNDFGKCEAALVNKLRWIQTKDFDVQTKVAGFTSVACMQISQCCLHQLQSSYVCISLHCLCSSKKYFLPMSNSLPDLFMEGRQEVVKEGEESLAILWLNSCFAPSSILSSHFLTSSDVIPVILYIIFDCLCFLSSFLGALNADTKKILHIF